MPFFNYKYKKCYYEEHGSGKPLLFLHGNTASSKMFTEVIPYYCNEFKVIVPDFMGHGKSERVDFLSADLWFDEAMQVISLIDQLGYKKVNLAGSSGGALAALNVGLERPELVEKIIADSFEGEVPLAEFAAHVKEEREQSKRDGDTLEFYRYNHGADWEKVVDQDTEAIFKHYHSIGTFYHKQLNDLRPQVLLTGSKKDEFAVGDFYEKTYGGLLKKIENGEMHLFPEGGHPAMLTNGAEFAAVAKEFLKR